MTMLCKDKLEVIWYNEFDKFEFVEQKQNLLYNYSELETANEEIKLCLNF